MICVKDLIAINFVPFSKVLIGRCLKYDFEKVFNLTYPEIDKIRNKLETQKALFVSLSGKN